MLVLLLFSAMILPAGPDPATLIRQAVAAGERNAKMARSYSFTEREVIREKDGNGRVKKTEISTSDITLLEGERYERLVQKDDKPLPEKDEKKEQEKLEKSIRERQKESPKQREKRLAEMEKNREEQRKFLREIADAYTFRMLPEESIAGRAAWVIECTPRPDFKPTLKDAAVLGKLKGKLWIDQQDVHFVRVEAEVIDTISFGFSLVRVHKGSHLIFEDTLVNNEVWLPKRSVVDGSARLAYLKVINGEQETTYRDYRKTQVESKVVATSEIP